MAKQYAVDIPNSADPDSPWINVEFFPTKQEAIEYCQKTFGADSKGRIGLISEISDD